MNMLDYEKNKGRKRLKCETIVVSDRKFDCAGFINSGYICEKKNLLANIFFKQVLMDSKVTC